MTQKRKRINARIPEPNDNFSMTVGNKVIVDAVFRVKPAFDTYAR